MARARNIKPGFFTNDELVELPFEYRLLFVGLWTIADRDGRLVDRPKKIKMEIFPGDSVDCETGLCALEDAGFIQRYEVEGHRYIQVSNWAKHQNPHVKEAASSIPAPGEHGASTVQTPDESLPLPERAGLIPDSLNLIPDSPSPISNPIGLVAASPAEPPQCPHKEIIALYHELLPTSPAIRDWTPARAEVLRTRWKEDKARQDLDWWTRFFQYIADSPFLTGKIAANGRKPFCPGLEWICKAENFAKIREGRYHEDIAA